MAHRKTATISSSLFVFLLPPPTGSNEGRGERQPDREIRSHVARLLETRALRTIKKSSIAEKPRALGGRVVVVVVRAGQKRRGGGSGKIPISTSIPSTHQPAPLPSSLFPLPLLPPSLSLIPRPPFSPRAAARSLDPRSRSLPVGCSSVRVRDVPAAGHTHLPLRHRRRLLPPPEPQGRAGPLPRRRRRRRGGRRRRGDAAPFQGCIGCEDRILDDGGHGKRAVPLEDPCCTTGKI